jgi:hypothetical protein
LNWTSKISIRFLIIFLCFGLLFGAVQIVYASVRVIYFAAFPQNGAVVIEWRTAGELGLNGFNVYRSVNPDSNFIQVNTNLIPPTGEPLLGDFYELTDQPLNNGTTYYYRLELVKSDLGRDVYGPLQVVPGSNTPVFFEMTPTVFPGSSTPTQVTVGTATRTPTSPGPLPTDTRTAAPPTLTFTPTLTPTVTLTLTPSITPTGGILEVDTITPASLPDFSASETAIVSRLQTEAAALTPQIEPETGQVGRDWPRIVVLILLGAVWVFLGAWLYIYLSRLGQ